MVDLRGLAALWAGKATIFLSRRFGRGGSTLPSRVAALVDAGLLPKLARRHHLGNILITGTNGKTTTARLLAHMLQLAGYRVSHNRSGANLISGITSAFIETTPVFGPVGLGDFRDVGLAEVDEAAMPRAAADIGPRQIVVTNFFRDQLDRFGELRQTVDLVRAGIGAMAMGGNGLAADGPAADGPAAHRRSVVLNADDPLVSGLADGVSEGVPVVFFGVEDASLGMGVGAGVGAPQGGGEGDGDGDGGDAGGNRVIDARHCLACGYPYEYAVVYYAHVGKYRCPACGQARPRPDIALMRADDLDGAAWWLRIATPAGELEARFPLPGFYNLYNVLAAVAAGHALGLPLAVMEQAIETFATGFGRMEAIPVEGREVRLALVKNPVGFNEVLRALLSDHAPAKEALIAINDRHADGTDISWLWDVDFERLSPRSGDFRMITVSGTRAEEMFLRLKYAGFPLEKVSFGGDAAGAFDQALGRVEAGGRLWLLPTYTALMEIRDVISRRGHARHFWEV